jgi:endonuclease YncB( thermonuclease family)
MRRAVFSVLLVAVATTTALCARQRETFSWAGTPSQTFSGTAKVVDGDSLEVGATRIWLFGIDAPEGRQTCTRDSKDWPCGVEAANKLRSLIGGRPIDCVQRDVDQYKRVVAVCTNGATDLNAAMVRAGLALAYRHYSNDYVADEDDARSAQRGMWAGAFTAPWDYRHSHSDAAPEYPRTQQSPQQKQSPLQPDSQAGGGCLIKGNINGRGERIYHVPGTRGYDETVITESKGERWFGSEQEAESAGWRAPHGG